MAIAGGAKLCCPARTDPAKNRSKKQAKLAEKAQRKAEASAKPTEAKPVEDIASPDSAEGLDGTLSLNQNQDRSRRDWILINDLSPADVGRNVLVRARLASSRYQGKLAFLIVRQRIHTLQVCVAVGEGATSKKMVQWVSEIPSESVILVEGTIRAVKNLKTTTVRDVELVAGKMFLVARAADTLPFSLADASRAERDYDQGKVQYNRVLLETRLNNRVLDLRTPTNQAIFTLQSAVTHLLSAFLQRKAFTEIHTPKLQAGASESGSSVFKVNYFKRDAFLAVSPDLAKQMCMAADFERVYEIGPVFRAENSFTHRHLTEFTALDLEMAIEEHYDEVISLLDDALKEVFRGLKEAYRTEIDTVRRQFPADDFKWQERIRLTFEEAIDLLVADGMDYSQLDDIDTTNEKRLGRIVRNKYETDFFIIDKFPIHLRPFYTMPDPIDPALSDSFDFFMRGEEILSGAQRIHDPTLLGIDVSSMQSCVDAFKLGCPPHGGGGIGLERVLMLYLQLNDIRRASLFPRDHKRLTP
ncbi:aspartate-tRNA ligase [Rickenella mellea]|uniref:aspartate--tRNA ligase n=1 Tax=Rickenella mellea TaxID=50990 RepID=A0A4Y7PZU1_9AGAM|nr:aspartate-tRNA ligase [Rickenella mellea]